MATAANLLSLAQHFLLSNLKLRKCGRSPDSTFILCVCVCDLNMHEVLNLKKSAALPHQLAFVHPNQIVCANEADLPSKQHVRLP